MIKVNLAKCKPTEFVLLLPFKTKREYIEAKQLFKVINFPERTRYERCYEFYLQFIEDKTITVEDISPYSGHTLDVYIRRFGEIDGTLKFNEFLSKHNGKGTLVYYKKKHGDNLGEQLYKEKNLRLSISYDSLKRNGYSDIEISEIQERHREKSKNTLQTFIERFGIDNGEAKYKEYLLLNRTTLKSCIEYYTSRGICKDIAKQMVSEFNTKTLEKFIATHGESGHERYTSYNKKKAVTLENFIIKYGEVNGRKKFNDIKSGNSSNIEIEFIESLISKIDSTYTYAYGKQQYKILLDKSEFNYFGKSCFYLDFYIKELNLCIEFHGDIFHANPNVFNESDTPHPFYRNLTSKDIWNRDKKRKEKIQSLGITYVEVWEQDYKNNSNTVIEKCKTIITNLERVIK